MHTDLECMPCFLHQLIRTSRIVKLPNDTIWKILKETTELMRSFDHVNPPPKFAVHMYDLVVRECKCKDPFKETKKQSTEQVLKLYDKLKEDIEKSEDPLTTAIKYSACGNVIDFGVSSTYDLMTELQSVLTKPFAMFHIDHFKQTLKNSDWILYLADNAGESVFDRLLIEKLPVPVVYAVRGGPIINDVTMEDAIEAGIDKVASVTTSGCRAPGTVLEWCSKDFLKLFNSAPLIISKGQGNYETLSEEKNRPIYFVLKAKCDVVSRSLNCKTGDMIFAASSQI